MAKKFKNALVYTENGIEKTDVVFNEKILFVGTRVDESQEIEVPEGCIVVPGFIDIHTHGANGVDLRDKDIAKSIKTMSEYLIKEGTTAFLPTIASENKEHLLLAVEEVSRFTDINASGAQILGSHLEGPFINTAFSGALNKESISIPSIKYFEELLKASNNTLKLITIAPELTGAQELISYVAKSGVTVSVGHSAADYECMQRALDFGAKNVTHTFNAQSGIHHREIGVAGSALVLDYNCELIADLIHVSLPAIKLLIKCKEKGKIILVTDSISFKGIGKNGFFEADGERITVKEGQARLSNGKLAGSILHMNEAIRNMVNVAKVPFENVIDFATKNPARSIGVYNEMGSISVGKRANFTVLDGKINVVLTIINGEIVYKNNNII